MFGKIIGGFLGYLVGGGSFFLALLGVFVGHIFDTGYRQAQLRLRPSPEQLKKIQDTFFKTVFQLLGHLAKADGRISEEEVQQTEAFMVQMGLTPEHRREAIELFKAGSQPEFDVQAALSEFKRECGLHANLVQMLLVYLIHVALADGEIDEAEQRVLHDVAKSLGMPSFAFEQMIRMIRAQESFRTQSGGAGYSQTASADQLSMAYEALGVKPEDSDAVIKRAYRKLMSQYHPDKLTGQGVPEDMIQEATERSQEIQAAYDTIKKSRQK
ncbi:co-chaperone DjlA [Aurantivibrio plasticivorans]